MPVALKHQSFVTSEKIRLKKMPIGMTRILTPHFNVGRAEHLPKKECRRHDSHKIVFELINQAL
jgi:hypothetical protein